MRLGEAKKSRNPRKRWGFRAGKTEAGKGLKSEQLPMNRVARLCCKSSLLGSARVEAADNPRRKAEDARVEAADNRSRKAGKLLAAKPPQRRAERLQKMLAPKLPVMRAGKLQKMLAAKLPQMSAELQRCSRRSCRWCPPKGCKDARDEAAAYERRKAGKDLQDRATNSRLTERGLDRPWVRGVRLPSPS